MARQVKPLEEFTFESTGYTVNVRPVSPMLAQEVYKSWRKSNPPPEPPLQVVEVLGVKRQDRNFDDPSWKRAAVEYEARMREEVGMLSLKLMVSRGVVCEVDAEEVQSLRDSMAAAGVELDTDDKYVFVTMICAGTQAEMNELRDRIMTRSQPTPKEVAAAVEEFPGQVQE